MRKPFKRGKAIIFCLALVWMVVMAWPIVWAVLTSLKDPQEIHRFPITWLPDHWTNFSNYRTLINEYPMGRWLLNSAIVTAMSLSSTLFFCSLAGYAFAKLRFVGKEFLFISVIALIMMPPEITIVPLYLMFSKWGLVNTYAGIVGPNWLSVIGVFIMRQFMTSIPMDYIDSARVDGAGEFRIFFQIALPMTVPGFVTLAILKSILTWNDFLWPLVMASETKMMTSTVGIQTFSTAFYIEYTLIATAAVITIIPLITMFLLLQRWVMQSMVMSGLKG